MHLQAPQNRLVTDNQDVILSLEFHDDGLKPDDDITIRLAAAIPVVKLVLVSVGEVIWIRNFDFCSTSMLRVGL